MKAIKIAQANAAAIESAHKGLNMLSKLICSAFGHRYTVDRVLNDGARKVGCARCGKSWAMHDATRSLIPWDSELEALYAPEGDLARPLRGASSMAAEG